MGKSRTTASGKASKAARQGPWNSKATGVNKKGKSGKAKKAAKALEEPALDEIVEGSAWDEDDQDMLKELDALATDGEEDSDNETPNADEEMSEEGEEAEADNMDTLKSLADEHKRELEVLKKQDPEFYKHLESEDTNLLEFELSDEEEQSLEEESEDEGDEAEQPEKKPRKLTVLTMEKVNDWTATLEKKHDIKTFQQLLIAFKTAVRSSEDEETPVKLTYKILEPTVFTEVVLSTLRYASIVFNKQLDPKAPMSSPNWSATKSFVRTYLASLLHFLQNASEEKMLLLITQEAEKCSTYWACFTHLAKPYLKTLVNNYANFTSSDKLRIQSFLAIRSLAQKPIIDKNQSHTTYMSLCLKSIYLEFVRNCKTTNIHTVPAINLMRNLAVQLYGMDQALSYELAFVYIRQLAIHLRGAMQLKTKESFKPVYNWQYIHCIDFWANVLATYCQANDGDQEESPLKLLVFPLVQVALGAVRLIPTAQYFPLRFHVLRSMVSLGKSTQAYIPLASELIVILDSSELKRKPSPSTIKPLDWDVNLRAPQQYIHSRTYQDAIFEQLCECLKEHYKGYAHHISFPEFVIPSIVALKRSLKKIKNIKGAQRIQDVIEMLENKTAFIQKQRSNVDFSPAEQDKVDQFIVDMKRKL